MDARSDSIPYRGLDKDKREIRLLLLEDLPENATYFISGSIPLRAKLIHTSLDLYREYRNAQSKFKIEQLIAVDRWTNTRNWRRPSFYALSYVWGNPTPVREIEIDGQPIKVGASLGEALEAILLYTPHRVIWADALCINQNDKIEKSWQVQQMGKIYARARAVISWLGPATSDSDVAMYALQDLHKLIESIKFNSRPQKNAELIADAFRRIRTCGEDVLESIQSLLARDYWSRVWIIQELAVPRATLFICGRTVVFGIDHVITTLESLSDATRTSDYADLLKLWTDIISQNDSALIPIVARYRNFRSLKNSRHLQEKVVANVPLLLAEVGFSDHCKATDPRDLLFALLPLAVDTDNFQIIADYNKSTAEIFTMLARKLVENGYLDLILRMIRDQSDTSDLPSWVPDWSSSHSHSMLMKTSVRLNVKFDRRARLVRAKEDELVVGGMIIGQIDTFGPQLRFDDNRRRSPEEMYLAIARWISQVTSSVIRPPSTKNSQQVGSDTMPTFESIFGRAAVARTVVCDYNHMTGNSYGNTALELESLIHDEDFIYSLGVAQDTGISGPYEMATLKSAEVYLRGIFSRIISNECRVFAIGKQYIGLSTKNCEKGDIVAWLDNTEGPCVLRPVRTSSSGSKTSETISRFQLVGAAFVDGIVRDNTIVAEHLRNLTAIVLY